MTPLVVPLHAANPGAMTGAGNWTYFLPGRHPLMIDAGIGEPAHLLAIRSVRAEGPGHVIVTHAHQDHVAGAVMLAGQWPSTRFSKLAWPERDALHEVTWTYLADGQIVAAGDGELSVVHTPGHAPDHIALWHAASRTLFSGDLVTVGTTVVIPASSGGSLSAYLHSLQRVLDLAPARLLPAHGEPIDDPARLVRAYIAHRHEREAQVHAALRQGLRTPEALVAQIYPALPAAILPMARETVLAHLMKLEEEGVVRRDSDGWDIMRG